MNEKKPIGNPFEPQRPSLVEHPFVELIGDVKQAAVMREAGFSEEEIEEATSEDRDIRRRKFGPDLTA